MSQNGNQNQNSQNNQNKQLSWTNGQQGGSQHNNAPQQQKVPAPIVQKPADKPVVSSAPNKSAADSNRKAAKVAGWLAIGVVAGVVIAWGATSLVRHSGTSTTTAGSIQNATTTPQTTATSTLLTVASPQKAGTTVDVSGVNVSEPTWIVVNESRDGKPGNVLGAALFFPGNSSGTVTLLRGTVAGDTYFVSERKDNGDRRFSMSADVPVTIDGQPSSATFTAN